MPNSPDRRCRVDPQVQRCDRDPPASVISSTSRSASTYAETTEAVKFRDDHPSVSPALSRHERVEAGALQLPAGLVEVFVGHRDLDLRDAAHAAPCRAAHWER